MSNLGIFFIYGLCVMFNFMMTWFFIHKNNELLSKLVAVLMAVIGLQCLKDLFFISSGSVMDNVNWYIMSAIDMVTVPLYVFILVELCRPASLTLRTIVWQELSFVVPIVLFVVTRNYIFYYATVTWAAVYGFCYAVWTIIAIPKYHERLKQCFSYDENINLNWLKIILGSFSIILALWITDCLIVNIYIEALYMLGSLVIWMFICYFIYKHESVIEELSKRGANDISEDPNSGETDMSEIGVRITALFCNEKIFLNPNLKLSDIAKTIGTNRTYVSAFFNKEAGCTFYDYVNRLRIEAACDLLVNSKENLSQIAEKTGFNSSHSFIRVFSKMKGVSPTEFRGSSQISE